MNEATVGSRTFSDEQARRYPPLSLTLTYDMVRLLYQALPFIEPSSKYQMPILVRLKKVLGAELAATEKRTGLKVPDLRQGPGLFDEAVQPVTMVLSDCDTAALKRSLNNLSGYVKANYLAPNTYDRMNELYLVLSDHFGETTGYDHSKSIDNLSWMHEDSPVWQAYYAEQTCGNKERHPLKAFLAFLRGGKA